MDRSNMAGEPLRRGQFIRLTYKGRTRDAMIVLASSNGRSLIAMFDGMLGGYLGMMPLFQEEDGTYIDLMERQPAGVELKEGG